MYCRFCFCLISFSTNQVKGRRLSRSVICLQYLQGKLPGLFNFVKERNPMEMELKDHLKINQSIIYSPTLSSQSTSARSKHKRGSRCFLIQRLRVYFLSRKFLTMLAGSWKTLALFWKLKGKSYLLPVCNVLMRYSCPADGQKRRCCPSARQG